MYSDTHFHFKKLCEDSVEEGSQILKKLNEYSPVFELDIGTKPDDLVERTSFIKECMEKLTEDEQKKVMSYIYGLTRRRYVIDSHVSRSLRKKLSVSRKRIILRDVLLLWVNAALTTTGT